jgi:hypothetical protein
VLGSSLRFSKERTGRYVVLWPQILKNNSEFWPLAQRLSKIVELVLTLNQGFKIKELGQKT